MLGCGTSVGVPCLGRAGWGQCDPLEPKNRRQRSALLVQSDTTSVLVDAGPDIRNQLLLLDLKKLDGVLITHTHSDHVAGIDDLRVFFWPDKVKIPVYITAEHGKNLTQRVPYMFEVKPDSPGYFVPPLELRQITVGDQLQVGDIKINILHQNHGLGISSGFIFNNVCGYSTDVNSMPEDTFAALAGIPLWIVETLREEPHQAHAHYDLTFSWIDRVRPNHAILTHLGLEADYKKLKALCPVNVEPGYDGLSRVLEFDDKNAMC